MKDLGTWLRVKHPRRAKTHAAAVAGLALALAVGHGQSAQAGFDIIIECPTVLNGGPVELGLTEPAQLFYIQGCVCAKPGFMKGFLVYLSSLNHDLALAFDRQDPGFDLDSVKSRISEAKKGLLFKDYTAVFGVVPITRLEVNPPPGETKTETAECIAANDLSRYEAELAKLAKAAERALTQ